MKPGPRLARLLRERREELIQVWTRRVLEDPRVPEANRLSEPELHDHVPEIIDELVGVLERSQESEACGRDLGSNEASRSHARQRRERGYALASSLRELSHFRAALVQLCTDEGTPLDGDVAELVHAVVDQNMITGAIEMEQAALEEHSRQSTFRERFIGILGHDLRSPLTTITTAVATLQKRDDATEGQQKLLRRVASSADRMGRLIRDLLDVTRIRLGTGIPISPRPIELRALFQGAVEEHEITCGDRTIVLDASEPVRGVWDADRLEQVIGNLLGNALGYSAPGTQVSIALRREANEAVFEVHNHGPAIPAEALPRLFDLFYQGPQDGRMTRPVSVGLGLFITKQIVDAHGGSITVRSTSEDGTTFCVRLPGATTDG
ncbi:MAG: sensor histidine kinase [Minicystis sp.]